MSSISKQLLNQILIDSGSKKTFLSKERPVFDALRGLIASTAGDDIDYNKVLLCFVQNPLKPVHPKDTFFTHVVESANSDYDDEVDQYLFRRDAAEQTQETRAFFVLRTVLEKMQLTLPAYAVMQTRSPWDINPQRAVLLACFISLNNPRLIKLFAEESDLSNYVTTLFILVDSIFPAESESRYHSLAIGMSTLATASDRLWKYPNHFELVKLGAVLADSSFYDESNEFFDALSSRADLNEIIDATNKARQSNVPSYQLIRLLKTRPTDLFAQINALEDKAHNSEARRSLISEVFGSYWGGSSGDRDNHRIHTKIQKHTNPVLALQLIQFYNQFSIGKNDREILLSHSNLVQLAAIKTQLTALQQSALVSKEAMLAIVRFTLKDPYPSDTMAYFMVFKRQVELLRAEGHSHAMINLAEAQVILGLIDSVGSDLAKEAIDRYLWALNTKLRAVRPSSALVSTSTSTPRFFGSPLLSQSVPLDAQSDHISTVGDDINVAPGLS